MTRTIGIDFDNTIVSYDALMYEAALKKLVKRKAAGKTIEAPEPQEDRGNVIDLMDALKRSLGRRSAAKHARQSVKRSGIDRRRRRKSAA